MAPPLSLPTASRLPPSLRVSPSNAAVVKAVNRLSRPSLLSLVLDWLDPKNVSLCPPLLRRLAEEDEDDEDDLAGDLYPPARSLAALRELYTDMQERKGGRREVVDRILEGDWRDGLSLYQLAMADQQYLYDHPGSLKWACYKIQRLQTPAHEDDVEADNSHDKPDRTALNVPRFHPSTFLENLQAEVLPDVKAHYSFDRPKGMPLLLLRIFVLDSPYNTDLAMSSVSASTSITSRPITSFDSSRTIYIAFPDASPHIFVSKSQSMGPTTTGDTRSLRQLVVEGVPKALSRPRERYTLTSVNLQTKNLDAMLSLRGAGRSNSAAGGWSVYAGDKSADAMTHSPLNPMLPSPPLSDEVMAEEKGMESVGQEKRKRIRDPDEIQEEKRYKRARLVAQARFGGSAKMDDGKGIERLDVLLEDTFPQAVDENMGDKEVPAPAQGRKAKGRRSAVDTNLAQETEGDENEEDGEDTVDYDRDAGAANRKSNQDGARPDLSKNRDNEKWAWRPNPRLAFHGPHIFAGIRQLVEAGIIDGERMPGWMTGEEGVTMAAVRHGRVKGHRGAGL
ncbi:centromere protein Chl4/mis15/CENP-N [Xylariaceae sp. FL1019]|nr:centromere protein Chl4/mis15/CENP-N [Xylariaceae sp. FL1019]